MAPPSPVFANSFLVAVVVFYGSRRWSHHALTTLTNEQIVAEIKWTEKAILDATGLRVRYMRPPYGDVDNRVRFVLKKLGYTVVDWGGDTFDSNDWKSKCFSFYLPSTQIGSNTSLCLTNLEHSTFLSSYILCYSPSNV